MPGRDQHAAQAQPVDHAHLTAGLFDDRETGSYVRAPSATPVTEWLQHSAERTAQGRGSTAEYAGWIVGGAATLVGLAHVPKYFLQATEKVGAAAFRNLRPVEGTVPIVRDYRFGDGFSIEQVAKSAGFHNSWRAETVKVLERPGAGPIGFASFSGNEVRALAVSPLHRDKSSILLKATLDHMAETGGTWLAVLKPETSGRLVEFYAKKGKFEILERTPHRLPGFTGYRLQIPKIEN